MTDQQPQILCLPQEENDITAANSLNNVISYEWNKDDMQEKLVETIRNQLKFGTAILKTRWDPTLLPDLGGDITCDIVDIFDFFPDPDAVSPSGMEWCIHRIRMPLRKVRSLYKNGKLVPSNDKYAEEQRRENPNDMGLKGANCADVLEMWHYDDSGNIQVTTVANGILLEDKESPYEDQDLGFPFIFFYNYKLTGEFWGIGEIEQLESLQLQLNKIHQVILDTAIAGANSPIIVDKTAGVKKGSLSNEPGIIIEKNPGGNITRLAPAGLPPFIQEQLELTKRAMEDVSGVHDVTKGVASGSVTAASALNILTENSQTKIRAKLRNAEYAVKNLGKWYLSLIRQFMDSPRYIRIAGDKSFILFDASQLRKPQIDPLTQEQVTDPETGQPVELLSQFDIKVSSGSSFLINKSARYEQSLVLFQNHALDPETLLNNAEIGDTKEILNRMVQYGILPDPNKPQVDPKQILESLGFKYSMTTSDPMVIADAIQKALQEAEAQVKQNPVDPNAVPPEAPPQNPQMMPQ